MNFSIVLTGTGGQGTILATRVISLAAVKNGYKVRSTESLGMAQRGGSVVSHLRFGNEIYSPLVPEGGADVLLGFELIEAVRRADKLKRGGVAIINDLVIPPREVLAGSGHFSEAELRNFINGLNAETFTFNFTGIAVDAGSFRVTSAVMLGAFSARSNSPLSHQLLRETLIDLVPEKMTKINLAAFDMGREAAGGSQ